MRKLILSAIFAAILAPVADARPVGVTRHTFTPKTLPVTRPLPRPQAMVGAIPARAKVRVARIARPPHAKKK